MAAILPASGVVLQDAQMSMEKTSLTSLEA